MPEAVRLSISSVLTLNVSHPLVSPCYASTTIDDIGDIRDFDSLPNYVCEQRACLPWLSAALLTHANRAAHTNFGALDTHEAV